MQQLRAPWRQAYVTSKEKPQGCVLCAALQNALAPDSLVVHVADLCFVVMNLYAYNSGHVMVSPRRHVGRLADASPEELAETMLLARRLEGILGEAYKPDGLNVGMNLGRAAGAGVAEHIHLHLVPRWAGDSNFLSVVGETRVIPEDPREACLRLRRFFERP
jgi:ATP adenylyltransferase